MDPLGVGELEADDVEDFGTARVGVVLDVVVEAHADVGLARYIHHVHHALRTCQQSNSIRFHPIPSFDHGYTFSRLKLD